MGIPMRDARDLTLWEYTSQLHENNRRASNEKHGGEPMTDEEFDDILGAIRALHLSDVRV